jgi:hypothetical protein
MDPVLAKSRILPPYPPPAGGKPSLPCSIPSRPVEAGKLGVPT